MIQTAHFLVNASLPRAIAAVLATAGHQALDIRDTGLGNAADAAIAEYARTNGLCLVTRDGDFGKVLDYSPEQHAGIVVLSPGEPASRDTVIRMVKEFLHEAVLLPLFERSVGGRRAGTHSIATTRAPRRAPLNSYTTRSYTITAVISP